MLLSNFEYIPLRLVRKFLVPEGLARRAARFLPFYLAPQGRISPRPIVDRYESALRGEGGSVAGKQILEVGTGGSNGTAYELAARGARIVTALEPYVGLEEAMDSEQLRSVAASAGVDPSAIAGRTSRITSLDAVPPGSIDLVLSHSVLEHVLDPAAFLSALAGRLASGGSMVHVVDYRDHFFKYPYHFLQFSRSSWDRFLNPGDLPRWRLGDHLSICDRLGLAVEVLQSTEDRSAFARIAPYLSRDFRREDPTLAVLTAVLRMRRRETS
ncbi:MAG: methyltransferase domain-containing protein [Planctomycetes bacterium]|nr:methyltransferase domain-containing protein [Planctomycetota bacterium]